MIGSPNGCSDKIGLRSKSGLLPDNFLFFRAGLAVFVLLVLIIGTGVGVISTEVDSGSC